MPKKTPVRQYAALPIDLRSGTVEIVLVTSRTTGRWIIPKGKPEAGLPGHEVARREAFEEAGLIGATARKALGTFDSVKGMGTVDQPVRVSVYPFRVDGDTADFPERGQREILRASFLESLMLLSDGGLISLLLRYEDELVDLLPPLDKRGGAR
ncbi:NUDIX hydrolase [Zavarzinia compransoris]|uniref:NUDIX hydrolase n=1 Tax=Zavarzinia marina TaxID=2911065 RepID=UPI001F1780E2|nr:NUDIX hydrolase [Zavarzinia marina]MCF4165474.1 NUDIX hydrolase [Zavarzinia marina]